MFDDLCNVSDMPKLREAAALNICSWKTEHEQMYAEFKQKMDNASAGDLSTIEAMFALVSDCIPEEPEKSALDLPGYASPEDIWQNLPLYAKSYIAEVSREDGKASKDDCLSMIEEATDYMNTCMSFVPSVMSNLYNKTMVEENDLIRCMYYYMIFDGGATKLMAAMNDIITDEIVEKEDMAMIHSCISSLVSGSIDLGVESKESWEEAMTECDPEIWKDVTYELSKSNGNRGSRKKIQCLDNLLEGNKIELKKQIRLFIDENPTSISLAYLLQALIRAKVVKKSVKYTTFHRAIEHFAGCKFGIDVPQKRFGELKDFTFRGQQKGSWAVAKDIIYTWTDIFAEVAHI